MPIQAECGVCAVEQLNPYAYSLLLDGSPIARTAFPGQFIHVRCGHSRLLRRPISICSTDGGFLRIVFEVRGEGTEWLSRRKVGDRLDVLGPLGHGFQIQPERRYLLAGGGVGVPPLVSCCTPTSTAVLGVRDAAHAMLLGEFIARHTWVVQTSDDGSVGARGTVAQAVERLLVGERPEGERFDAVLACGPKPMLRTVAEVAKRHGLPCQVSLEERMACGVGACLGCAVRMADGRMLHACKDGPVFDAAEVDWDA